MRTLWIHPFNGIAGDMMLGALIDVGADVGDIRTGLEQLEVDGWSLRAEPILRNGISATNVTVEASEGHVHRTAADIAAIVDRCGLPDRVRTNANRVFAVLAEAEGAVHGKQPGEVHFHEVGGIDAIVDVVGTCLALDLLNIEQVIVSPVGVGHGITKSAHGRIPHPAPATVRLLEGVPVKGIDTSVELTTPTGAAIVRAFADAYGPSPAMTVSASGFGAGDAEVPGHPNLLQVLVGEAAGKEVLSDSLLVLETNIDDLTGEYLAHAIETLLEAGALDAWITPIEMKRQRPAVTFSVLVDPLDLNRLGAVLLAETGSLGFRSSGVDRRSIPREVGRVEIAGQSIAIKTSADTTKAEFRDVVAAAKALDRPARLVASEAEAQWARSVASNE